MNISLPNIPQDLREFNQWVAWKLIERNGKSTKVPYDPRNGNNASVTNPNSWCSFNEIINFINDPDYSGIGFVFTEDDPFCGIDLDKCINPETGEISAHARKIIHNFNSYTEVSPSGTGVKIFIKGKKYHNRNRKGDIEIYDAARFFTVTSNFLKDYPKTIEDRNVKLKTFEYEIFGDYEKRLRQLSNVNCDYDRNYFLEYYKTEMDKYHEVPHDWIVDDNSIIKDCIVKFNEDDKFSRLFHDGDWKSFDYPSESEADLALCSMLSFFTLDLEQIDRIFTRSALNDEKWQNRSDYRKNTINTVLQSRADDFEKQKFEKEIIDGKNPDFSDEDTYKKLSNYNILEKNLIYQNLKQNDPKININNIKHQLNLYNQEQLQKIKEEYDLTEEGNARKMFAHFGDRFRYCHDLEIFLIWNGVVWEIDKEQKIMEFARKTLHEITKIGKQLSDKNKKKAILNHVESSKTYAKFKAMINLVKSIPGVSISADDLDQNTMIVACKNVYLDLGNIRAINPEPQYYITKKMNVEFDPDATCPTWDYFLNSINGGQDGFEDYLQRISGYCLTGNNNHHQIFFLYGEGRNGKSVFAETLLNMFGEIGMHTPPGTILEKKYDSIPEDLARLKGIRYVIASESDPDKHLSESIVKQVTGDNCITARYLYNHLFTYTPEFKILFLTNNLPHIRGSDYAIWYRIKVIPFITTIKEEDQDLFLQEKLKNEFPGILNWCLRGYQKYREQGLKEPQFVTDAVKQYRGGNDVFADFISECIDDQPQRRSARDDYVTKADMFRTYKEWCKENNHKPYSQKTFGIEFKRRKIGDIEKCDTKNRYDQRCWWGVKLIWTPLYQNHF
ncbi:MAG: hypothetical protein JXR73_10050 [Candidatus Omnitrophica bacterium]|nr:hypothetical protein [Candidatus Omnitrophota bacterium]